MKKHKLKVYLEKQQYQIVGNSLICTTWSSLILQIPQHAQLNSFLWREMQCKRQRTGDEMTSVKTEGYQSLTILVISVVKLIGFYCIQTNALFLLRQMCDPWQSLAPRQSIQMKEQIYSPLGAHCKNQSCCPRHFIVRDTA